MKKRTTTDELRGAAVENREAGGQSRLSLLSPPPAALVARFDKATAQDKKPRFIRDRTVWRGRRSRQLRPVGLRRRPAGDRAPVLHVEAGGHVHEPPRVGGAALDDLPGRGPEAAAQGAT